MVYRLVSSAKSMPNGIIKIYMGQRHSLSSGNAYVFICLSQTFDFI